MRRDGKFIRGGNFSREGKEEEEERWAVGESLDSKKCEAYIRRERERERKREKEASLLLVFVHVCPSPRIFIASLNLTSKDDPSFPSAGWDTLSRVKLAIATIIFLLRPA